MNLNRTKKIWQQSNKYKQASFLLSLLLLFLIGTGAPAVSGQEEPEPGIPPLVFADSKSTNAPESEQEANDEIWIKVTKDAYVASNDPNRNFGFSDLISFGFSPNGLGATRPLLFFDIASVLPDKAAISKAELYIYLANVRDSDSSRGYAAHYISQSWQQGSVTWNNMPQWGAEFARGTLGNSPGWQVTDVTSLAREWLKNPSGNNGVILVGDERPDQDYERDYFSRESSTGLYPQLYVSYVVSTDDKAPEAEVIQPSPPGVWSPANFVVAWEGSDPQNSDGTPGSGIRWYDVYYTTDNGATWQIGRAQVTTTETNVIGAPNGAKIGFYARARDNAGNEGPAPSGSASIQTWTVIDAQPPAVSMNPLPEFTANSSFQISWHDSQEANESGIRYYDVQYREENGSWLQLVYHTTATSTIFDKGRNGITYEFRARGVDNVGNEQPWGGAQAFTTVWLEPLAYIVPFPAPPIFQNQDGPSVGDGFIVSWEGLAPPGTTITGFDIRYMRPNSSTWLVWLNNTNLTSAKFELQLDDPDGVYAFQARARDDRGAIGPYLEEGEESIIVDRFGPFIELRSLLPIIFSYGDN